MLTHPDLLNTAVKQHMADLQAEAEHGRLLSLARRHRRSVSAARRAAAAEAASADAAVKHDSVRADDTTAPSPLATPSASLPAVAMRPAALSALALGRGVFGKRSSSADDRLVSEGQGSLTSCDPHAV